MKSRTRVLAAILSAALLFTQLAVAAFACPSDAGATRVQVQHESMPGCDKMTDAPSPLCPAHCAQGQQSLDKPASPVVAPCVLIGFASWNPKDAPHRLFDLAWRMTYLAAPPEPPLAIRNCCLRI